jgi:hypothetical protein
MKNKCDADSVTKIIDNWAFACHKLYEMISQDAQKEFEIPPRIGFGVDGDDAVRDADFDAVRGTFEDNSFIKELQKRQADVSKTSHEWIEKNKTLK